MKEQLSNTLALSSWWRRSAAIVLVCGMAVLIFMSIQAYRFAPLGAAGNLAELLLSYGFKNPLHKESHWTLRHFWKPRQVNPLRLKLMLDLARLQGWLSPLPECPIRVDAQLIPENYLDGFQGSDCASMDCQACGYCERIADQAVSISPEYGTEVLRKYADMDDAMRAGSSPKRATRRCNCFRRTPLPTNPPNLLSATSSGNTPATFQIAESPSDQSPAGRHFTWESHCCASHETVGSIPITAAA